MTYIPYKTQEALTTDTQAVSISTYLTTVANNTSAPFAYTIASGIAVDQVKKIVMLASISSVVITGNFQGDTTTATLSYTGDTIELIWSGSEWKITSIYNLVTNPPVIGLSATSGYGILALKSKSASKAFAGGATEVIPVQVPSGALIVGCQLRNDTTLVGTLAVSYSAAYSTGATQSIGTGIAFTKNTKTNKFFNVNAATGIDSGATDITLTPNAGTLDSGTVVAVVYYYELTSMISAP